MEVHVDDPCHSVEDEAGEDHDFAAGFPILDVGEFVGWEDLEDRPFDHLVVVGHGSL